MKKLSIFWGLGVIALLCINMGGGGERSAAAGKPEAFTLKRGRMPFKGNITDGGAYKGRAVKNICFRDNTYTDCRQEKEHLEGDTYLKVREEDSNIEQKILLENINSIEVVSRCGTKLFTREKDAGELSFLIRVTFKTGGADGHCSVREYLVNPQLSLSFIEEETGAQGTVLLHKIDKIENIAAMPFVAVPEADAVATETVKSPSISLEPAQAQIIPRRRAIAR